MDFDTVISVDPLSKDNTFDRIVGLRNSKEFITTNSTYGYFSQPENKYKKLAITERIYNDFFNCYVGKSNDNNDRLSPQSHSEVIDKLKHEHDYQMTRTRESLRRKVIAAAISKGWLGYRKLKLFLKSLSKKHDEFIHKDDVKYYFVNFGVCMDENETDFVFTYFQNCRNEINYEELLNSFIVIQNIIYILIHIIL